MKLHEYQMQAVNFMVQQLCSPQPPRGAGLFADPGLGKTAMTLKALEFLRSIGRVRRVLVIAPLWVVMNVWGQEIDKWGFALTYARSHGSPKKRLQAIESDADVVLINPENTRWLYDHREALERQGFDTLVIDESTKYKNWSSKRSSYLRRILPIMPYRIILTGTPASNSLSDVFPQIYLLDNGKRLGTSLRKFRSQYMSQGGFQGRQWFFKSSMKDDLFRRIGDIVLRLDCEDHLDMPEKIVNDIWIDLPHKVRSQYDLLEQKLFMELESGDLAVANSASSVYGMCRQIVNGGIYLKDEQGNRTGFEELHDAKVDVLESLVEELSGKPLMCFFQFDHDLARIRNRKSLRDSLFIKGGMRPKEVSETIERWNVGKVPLLLCQPQAVSHGLNLQHGGTDICWFGLTDQLEVYLQSNARIWRQGVSGAVRIHRVLSRDTVDVAMRRRLEDKEAGQGALLRALRDYASQRSSTVIQSIT